MKHRICKNKSFNGLNYKIYICFMCNTFSEKRNNAQLIKNIIHITKKSFSDLAHKFYYLRELYEEYY